jgi:hypothetical protein
MSIQDTLGRGWGSSRYLGRGLKLLLDEVLSSERRSSR